MRVLIIGSGGREHSLCWSIAASPLLTELYCAPGNGGTAEIAVNVVLNVNDHRDVIEFCHEHAIDLVVVGPEAPLVAGLADDLVAAGTKVIGPSKAASQLEGSKAFTKELCAANGIPTSRFARFSDPAEAKAYIAAVGPPTVVKADGLAAGKGVFIAESIEEAKAAIDTCFSGEFGASGEEILVEERLVGEEASFFVLTDGVSVLPLATAQDHKRIFDGDTGPNTGGMGAYSPAPVMTDEMCHRTMDGIIRPTIAAMARAGTPYKGVLYAGLMITDNGPQLIEYNVRFGDPECQVLLMRLKSDLLPALIATADGVLANFDLRWHQQPALTVVLATRGYPGAYERGSIIKKLAVASALENVEVFHAGTQRDENGIVRAMGGRVLNVTALGSTVCEAKDRAYEAIAKIDWPEAYYRTDIGWRAMAREKVKT